MTIYVRNWRNKWVCSSDTYPAILHIHLIQAKSRIWQIFIIPKHIILGAVYGYTSRDIWMFVKRHLTDCFRAGNRRVCKN